jgi:uncharacterized protein with HEPN domain
VPFRDWRQRIQDILISASEIKQRTNGITFEEFKSNSTIAKAVCYDFLIIGEAAINIPLEIQSRYPDIPWRVMGDMRNVMAHEYFQVALKIVWNTIDNNLPSLVLQLQELMAQEGIGE